MLRYLNLGRKPASFLGYLKERSCSKARLERGHRRIEDA
jgi:hypothetical protein